MKILTMLAIGLTTVVLVAMGCGDSGASPPTGGGGDAVTGDAVGGEGVGPAPDTGGPGHETTGPGPDTVGPGAQPRLVWGLTSGGGVVSSQQHQARISIGTPQPYGVAASANHGVFLGPVVPE